MSAALVFVGLAQSMFDDWAAHERRLKQVPIQDVLAVEELSARRAISVSKPVHMYVLVSHRLTSPGGEFDPRLVARLSDLRKRFISYEDYYKMGASAEVGQLYVTVEERVDASHLIASSTGSAFLVEKKGGKWRVLNSRFSKATSEAIRLQAFDYLLKTFCQAKKPCFLGVEDGPAMSLSFTGKTTDVPKAWLKHYQNLGRHVYPYSQFSSLKTGFEYVLLTQVQRVDSRRAVLRCEVGSVYGNGWDLPGYGEDYAYLLATRTGKHWKFKPHYWQHQPLE